jgi:NADH:ubiquinone oxidoreductase subunit H
MNPELQALYDAIELLLKEDILVQLVDIFSFFLGALTSIAFALGVSIRWH